MSTRVRFSEERPGVTYVTGGDINSSGLVADLFAMPMPPLHKESNFEMDAFTAASIGETNLIKQILGKQKSIANHKNTASWTPLLYAAYLGHHEVCTLLIESGAKLDECNKKGQTALMLAAACGNLQVVRVLLANGASTDRADRMGKQALHYAASCSQNVVVDHLLSAGADPNAADEEGMTPVLEACASGHELTFISLTEKGGDPFLHNRRGENGLQLAADTPKILQLIKDLQKEQGGGGYVVEPSSAKQPRTLEQLLDAMNLSRYLPRLQKENLDLSLFFSLTETDLDEIGVAYGPKKRMLTVIELYRQTGNIAVECYDQMPTARQTAAPPAYRKTSSNGSGTTDMLSSIRYIREVNEQIKQTAFDALTGVRGSNAEADRLRAQLTTMIDGMEKISTRLARHPL